MHCTWFNEKKSSLSPDIFVWVPFISLSLSKRPRPRSTPVGPRLPRTETFGKEKGHPPPWPSWPAAAHLAPGRVPAETRPRRGGPTEPAAPHHLGGKEGRVRPGRARGEPFCNPSRLGPCFANQTEQSLHFGRASRPAPPAPHPPRPKCLAPPTRRLPGPRLLLSPRAAPSPSPRPHADGKGFHAKSLPKKGTPLKASDPEIPREEGGTLPWPPRTSNRPGPDRVDTFRGS